MLKEFKNFIMTGNVIEFAVGVIMAGAVGAVVTSFVADIVMPLVGLLGAGDFSAYKYVITPEVKDAAGVITTPENAVRFGAWITTITSLVIVGFVMFMVVKAYAKMKAPAPDAPPAGPSQEELLTQIRDLLKK
jgi:large conductance mechanosensitive channel